jgi:hypothetical protein
MHAPLLYPVHATCPSPSHSSWFDYPNGISATCSLFHSSATSYLDPLRSIYLPQHPFSNTLSLRVMFLPHCTAPCFTPCHTHTHQLNFKNGVFFTVFSEYIVSGKKRALIICVALGLV